MNYPTIEQLQSFFFRAMLNSGWVGGGEITESTDHDGYKLVRFFDEQNELLLIDTWCSGDSGYSSGSTTIYMGRREQQGGKEQFIWVPVWAMTYMGRYDDEAISIVKAALREAYKSGQFFGGRGLPTFDREDWHYRNSIASHSTDDMFAYFTGTEEVTCEDIPHGYHHYTGILLFDSDNT